ncbi:MAG TPA: PKD domain-containing protein, partial [Thermoplasmata archaeon]|nr:PKD domain-containing protein [Thermoplasmata archaeon]
MTHLASRSRVARPSFIVTVVVAIVALSVARQPPLSTPAHNAVANAFPGGTDTNDHRDTVVTSGMSELPGNTGAVSDPLYATSASAASPNWVPPEVHAVPVEGGVGTLEYDPANGYLYVLGFPDVTVINGATDAVIGTIPIGSFAGDYLGGVTVDPVNGNLYVSANATVHVINTTTDKEFYSIAVGGHLGLGALDSSNGYLYLAHDTANNVVVVNTSTNKFVGKIGAGTWVVDVAYDSENGNLYATNAVSGNVTVISGTNDTSIGNISVGSFPAGVTFDPTNGYLYVANADSNTVSVIDGSTNKVVGTIPVGTGPDFLAYDALTGRLYVTSEESDNVSVIDDSTNQVVGTVKVGGPGDNPVGIAAGGSNGCVYVGNLGSGTVSVLAPPIGVTLSAWTTATETGTADLFTARSSGGEPPLAPRQYSWNFGDGTSENSTNESIVHTWWAPGTYDVNVTVTDAGGYTASASLSVVESPGP